MAEGQYRIALAELVERWSPKLDEREAWVGVEVGVADGKTAQHLLRRHPSLAMYLVDPYWGDVPRDDPYRQTGDKQAAMTQYQKTRQMLAATTRTKFAGRRARFVMSPSVEAAAHMDDATADWVFVDAQHYEDAVYEDSSAWWRVLRDGGLMVWHDYLNPSYPGVKRAVDRFVFAKSGESVPLGILPSDYLAYTIKTGEAER
jgi:hypothetical protein